MDRSHRALGEFWPVSRRGFLYAVAGTRLHAQLQPARVIILIGPPGSGKTVQANHIGKRYEVPVISMQSLLEQEVGKKTPLGKALAPSLASGELVTDGPANELIKARLLRADAGGGFVLDGYPASADQAKALDAFLEEHGFPKPVVVVIDVPDALLRERMAQRRRADDKPANIERRLMQYEAVGRNVEKWYGVNVVVRVDGRQRPVEVASRIQNGIDNLTSRRQLKVRAPGKTLQRRAPEP